MKLGLAFIFLLAFPLLAWAQDLKSSDNTENWRHPYRIADDKRQKLIDFQKNFKDEVSVVDLFKKLGKPDRIDDFRESTKPLSHFESGFMNRSKGKYSFRLIWFARKISKSPALGDSWLAAYVDQGTNTVSAVHSNYLNTDSKVGRTGSEEPVRPHQGPNLKTPE